MVSGLPVDPTKLDEVLSKIAKKYERDSIHLGNQYAKYDRISTGSLELDYATGGGIPLGRVTRFYGDYSSGKSLKCWDTIRNAQQMGLTCAFYDIEQVYDEEYVKARGVDTSTLHIVRGTQIESIGERLESLLGVVHLHVLDSYSSTVSIDELDADIEQWHRALNARVWGKVWRRVMERFDQNENAIILVDQVRDVMGPMGGEKPPGGRIPGHIASLTVHFKRGKWLYKDSDGVLQESGTGAESLSGQKEPDGQMVLARVEKSKVCRPFLTASMKFDFHAGSFDHTFELVKSAKFFKLVQVNGSWMILPNGEKIQGDKKLRKYIEEDQEFSESIRSIMLNSPMQIQD